MVIYTLLKLFDNNPELFRDYDKSLRNPLTSYIDLKLVRHRDFPLFGLRHIF